MRGFLGQFLHCARHLGQPCKVHGGFFTHQRGRISCNLAAASRKAEDLRGRLTERRKEAKEKKSFGRIDHERHHRCEPLPGHKDGAAIGDSLTGTQTPIRVAGIEFMDGAYAVGLDPLYEFTVTSSSSAFGCQPYECKKAKELNSEITLKYKIIEEILLSSVSTSWQWIEYFLLQN